jgi:phospholipid-translocating ATPase
MSGLRTLVMTRKVLARDFFEKWSNDYEYAYNRIEIDHKTINRLMNELEYGVNFLGVTGI